jgi:hypothetical protein
MIMMGSRPLDTTQEAERIQIECYRRMTPQERMRIGLQLSAMVRKSLLEGVRIRHPEYTGEQLRVAVIRLLLPEDLFSIVYRDFQDILP